MIKKETLQRVTVDATDMTAHNILFEINLWLNKGFTLIKVENIDVEPMMVFEKEAESEFSTTTINGYNIHFKERK